MNKSQNRFFNRMKAREAFMTVNEADFPAASRGGQILAALRVCIGNINMLAARKVSGKISQSVTVKDDKFDRLGRLLGLLNKGSRLLTEDVPGIEELYRMDEFSSKSEEARLAKARQMYEQSAEHETLLIETGLPREFRTQLQALIDEIETQIETTDAAQADRGGAVGALEAEIKQGNRLGTKLDNLIKIKYADDPDKLAAWLIASHLRTADSDDDEEDEEPPTEGETPMNN